MEKPKLKVTPAANFDPTLETEQRPKCDCQAGRYAEQLNQLSEALVGYREGSFELMKARALGLVNTAKQYQQNQQVASLFEAIRDLNAMADDIEQDA